MEIFPTDQFDKDLSVLTEMADCTQDEAVKRAVHFTAELMAHQRDGGTIILVSKRWWIFTKMERVRFIF